VRLTVCNIGSAHGHHRDFALPAPLGALPAVPFVIDPSPAADGGRGDSATGGAAPTEGGASVAAAGGGGSGGGGGKWAAAGAAAGGAAVSGADSDALPDMARQAVAGVQVQVGCFCTAHLTSGQDTAAVSRSDLPSPHCMWLMFLSTCFHGEKFKQG